MKKLSPEIRLVLASIPLSSTELELEQLDAIIAEVSDWDNFAKLIVDRGVAPLFHDKLPKLSNSVLVPEYVKWKVKQAYYRSMSRGAVLYEHFRQVATAFTAQGIDVIALKGIYLSEWLYKDIALRQFSDIDLLVRPEDAPQCLRMLCDMGYVKSDSGESDFVKSQIEIIHYAPMVKNGVSIELHIKLHSDQEPYHLPAATLWQNAQAATINTTPVKVLGGDDLLIHLCVHLDKHFVAGHVQFTCFMDIVNYIRIFGISINWIIFAELCRSYNAQQRVYKYIALVHKYIDAPIPEEVAMESAKFLSPNDELLFVKYLNGYAADELNTIPSHLRYLKRMSSTSERVRYVWEVVFPPRSFMIPKYRIKKPGKVWFYYPYRWWKGLKGLLLSR